MCIPRAGARLLRSWGLCAWSQAALERYLGGLGPLLGPMLAVLGGLRPLLGPMLAVLGCSSDLCGRSWAVCGRSWACVGSPWRPQAEKWAKPVRESDQARKPTPPALSSIRGALRIFSIDVGASVNSISKRSSVSYPMKLGYETGHHKLRKLSDGLVPQGMKLGCEMLPV